MEHTYTSPYWRASLWKHKFMHFSHYTDRPACKHIHTCTHACNQYVHYRWSSNIAGNLACQQQHDSCELRIHCLEPASKWEVTLCKGLHCEPTRASSPMRTLLSTLSSMKSAHQSWFCRECTWVQDCAQMEDWGEQSNVHVYFVKLAYMNIWNVCTHSLLKTMCAVLHAREACNVSWRRFSRCKLTSGFMGIFVLMGRRSDRHFMKWHVSWLPSASSE